MDPEKFFICGRLGDAQVPGRNEPDVGDTLPEKGIFLRGEWVPFRQGKGKMIGVKNFQF
jgi:hypothetical protein